MRVSMLLVLVGCGAAKEGDTVPEPTGDGCGFSAPDDLPDVENEIFGEEHACEEAPEYDPEVPWLTIWYVGDFHIDDCGVVSGREIWKVYPNPLVADSGMDDCEVVYTVVGAKGEPIDRGDYSLTLSLDVDLEATTCVILDGQPVWAGYEHMDLDYDVDTDPGGGSAVYFPESGTLLGQGYANESHVSYLSDNICTPYVTD